MIYLEKHQILLSNDHFTLMLVYHQSGVIQKVGLMANPQEEVVASGKQSLHPLFHNVPTTNPACAGLTATGNPLWQFVPDWKIWKLATHYLLHVPYCIVTNTGEGTRHLTHSTYPGYHRHLSVTTDLHVPFPCFDRAHQSALF